MMKFTHLLTAAVLAAGYSAAFAEEAPKPPRQDGMRRMERGPRMPEEQRKLFGEIRELSAKYRETKDAKVLEQLKAKLGEQYNAMVANQKKQIEQMESNVKKMRERAAEFEKQGESAFVEKQLKRVTSDRPAKGEGKGERRGQHEKGAAKEKK